MAFFFAESTLLKLNYSVMKPAWDKKLLTIVTFSILQCLLWLGSKHMLQPKGPIHIERM